MKLFKIMFAVAFFIFFLNGSEKEKPKIPVNVVEIKRGTLGNTAIFIGTLNYKETSNIASIRQGVVDKIYFNVGDYVKKGQYLLSLDSDLVDKELKAREAKIMEAQFQIQKISNELNRYKKLYESNSVALQQYENLEFDLKSKESSIESLRADFDLFLKQKEKMTIKAPFSGVMIEKLVNVGEWVSSGKAVALIINSNEPRIIVHVPENINFIKLKDKVKVKIENKDYEGIISAIIPKLDSKSKTFPVYIKIIPSEPIFDGARAYVTLPTTKEVSGFIVPRDSIINKTVFVIRENKALEIKIETLLTDKENAVVSGDFKANDVVVNNGQNRLVNGVDVEVKK